MIRDLIFLPTVTNTEILAAGVFAVTTFIIFPLLVAWGISVFTDPRGRFGRFRDFK